jgi:hypothetical protein
MQGFSYTQLYAALQAWPLKNSSVYLANLNRMIYLGELRLVIDLDLDIFDVNDQITIAANATTIPKPAQSQALTFTAGIAQGAESATLSTAWTGTTGAYVVTFSDQEIQAVTLTNAQTTATWTLPMAAAVTSAAVISPQMVTERNLWSVYSTFPRVMVKRSWDFVTMYTQAAAGRPLYYADQGTSEWIFGPPADGNTTAIIRRYIKRPVSIIIAQNTWLGDNVGQLLFVCCLMEMEHFIKADDRYADMKSKYYEELLPNARGEIMIAARSGQYAPLAPIASVPGPPQAAPQQAAAG